MTTALDNQHRPAMTGRTDAADHLSQRRNGGAATIAAPTQVPALAGGQAVDERPSNSEEGSR